MKKHAKRQEAVKDVMAKHGLNFKDKAGKSIKATVIHVFGTDGTEIEQIPVKEEADK